MRYEEIHKVEPLKLYPKLITWLLIFIGVFFVPAGEIGGETVKSILIFLVMVIGAILGSTATGYQIRVEERIIRVGFLPLVRSIQIDQIKEIKKGGIGMTIWQTNDFLTLSMKNGKEIILPTNNAVELINVLKPLINQSEINTNPHSTYY